MRWHKHAARSPAPALSHCSNAFPTLSVVPCLAVYREIRKEQTCDDRCVSHSMMRTEDEVSRDSRGGSRRFSELMDALRSDANIVGGVATVSEEKTDVNSGSIVMILKHAQGCPQATSCQCARCTA